MEMFQGNASKEEGYNLLQTGQIDEAIDAFNKALKTEPDDPQTYTFLGVAYNKKGDIMRAIRSFEESLRLSETARSYFNLAMMYESVHRYDEAIREYQMALDVDSNYARASEALNRLRARFEATHPKPEVVEDVPAEPAPEAVPENVQTETNKAAKSKFHLAESLRGVLSVKAKKA